MHQKAPVSQEPVASTGLSFPAGTQHVTALLNNLEKSSARWQSVVFSPLNLVMIEEDELSDVTVHGEDIGLSATHENLQSILKV